MTIEQHHIVPGAALHEGLSWRWQSFAEYLDALERMVKPMSPESRRAIVGQNVLDCYKL